MRLRVRQSRKKNAQNPPLCDPLEHAWAYYNLGDYRRALRESSKPRALNAPEYFEVRALILQKLGKKRKAIQILEKGVKICPNNARLWGLLANYYSDIKCYECSKEYYEKALNMSTLEGDFKPYVLYNYATMLGRCSEIEAAQHKIFELFSLEEFNCVDAEFYRECWVLKLSLHNRAQEYDKTEDAVALYENTRSPSEEEPYNDSDIYYEYAHALFESQRIKEAEEVLLRSLKLNKFHENTQWLLRQVRSSNPYNSAKYMRVFVHGLWADASDSPQTRGFFATYDVVADTEEEALGFIREIELEEIGNTLTVESIKILKALQEPKGIYKATQYFAYPLKNGD